MKLDILALFTHLQKRTSWDKGTYITTEWYSDRIVWQDGEPFRNEADTEADDWVYVYLNNGKWWWSTVKPHIAHVDAQQQYQYDADVQHRCGQCGQWRQEISICV